MTRNEYEMLRALQADGGCVGNPEIAKTLGISRPTARRVLWALAHNRWVDIFPRKRVGEYAFRITSLGAHALADYRPAHTVEAFTPHALSTTTVFALGTNPFLIKGTA